MSCFELSRSGDAASIATGDRTPGVSYGFHMVRSRVFTVLTVLYPYEFVAGPNKHDYLDMNHCTLRAHLRQRNGCG